MSKSAAQERAAVLEERIAEFGETIELIGYEPTSEPAAAGIMPDWTKEQVAIVWQVYKKRKAADSAE